MVHLLGKGTIKANSLDEFVKLIAPDASVKGDLKTAGKHSGVLGVLCAVYHAVDEMLNPNLISDASDDNAAYYGRVSSRTPDGQRVVWEEDYKHVTVKSHSNLSLIERKRLECGCLVLERVREIESMRKGYAQRQ